MITVLHTVRTTSVKALLINVRDGNLPFRCSHVHVVTSFCHAGRFCNFFLLISFSTIGCLLYFTLLLTIGFTFCRMTSCWRSCHKQGIPTQFSPICRNASTPLQSRLIASFFLDKFVTRLSLSCCSKCASQMFSFLII